MRSVGPILISLITAALLAASAAAPTLAAERPALPSAGCGQTTAELGVDADRSLAVDIETHTWVTYVPSAHDGSTPIPLWIQLHGCCGGSGYSEVMMRKPTAEERGVVLAGPDSWHGSDGWSFDRTTPELDATRSNPDVAFIDALIDQLGKELCIDLARVYASGYSAGGEGSTVLGCALEDRLAAVAPVAAMLDVGDACELDRPVPLLAVHGKHDGTAYFEGGYSVGFDDWPVVLTHAQDSIPDRVANVAARNGCAPEPTVEAVDDRAERWRWDCPPGAEVELIAHSSGHVWRDVTNDWIWSFFERQSLP